jgi:predicted component of type VI protein secretion system
MVKDAEASFADLFGDEFARAYEEQLERLKARRRPDTR